MLFCSPLHQQGFQCQESVSCSTCVFVHAKLQCAHYSSTVEISVAFFLTLLFPTLYSSLCMRSIFALQDAEFRTSHQLVDLIVENKCVKMSSLIKSAPVSCQSNCRLSSDSRPPPCSFLKTHKHVFRQATQLFVTAAFNSLGVTNTSNLVSVL